MVCMAVSFVEQRVGGGEKVRLKDHFVVILLLSHVRLSVTPWTEAHKASLSFTIYRSLLKLMSIKSVMPSNHLILCHPFLLLPSIFPSIGVFSNESILCIRWPKFWSITFIINPSRHQRLPMSQFFVSGGQSIGVSTSASVLPMNIQG